MTDHTPKTLSEHPCFGGVQSFHEHASQEIGLPMREDVHIGSRVYVRFDHGSEPLARQWYRSLRQVFLKQLNV